MKTLIVLIGFVFLLTACEPGELKVENSLPNAILKEVEWGNVPVSSQILPGETSSKVKIYDNDNDGIDLPESHELSFYLQVNGDYIYLKTKRKYRLHHDEKLTITVEDTTAVINPLLDN